MSLQDKLTEYITKQMKHPVKLYPHPDYPEWFFVEWTDGPTYDQVYKLCDWIADNAKTFQFKWVCQRKYSEGHSFAEHEHTDFRK